jgi:succinate dehydrogenase/fumarate reductase flavoprotein subunit
MFIFNMNKYIISLYDEYYAVGLIIEDKVCHGVICINLRTGELVNLLAKAWALIRIILYTWISPTWAGKKLKTRFQNIKSAHPGKVFNYDQTATLEIRANLDLTEVITRCALNRKESRGAHFWGANFMLIAVPLHKINQGKKIS